MVTRHHKERGFTMLAMAVSAACIFGMAGLAVDVGRLYITKNEAQSYADSAALYAAQQLDGTSAGLTAADTAVANNPMKWGFATTAFSGTTTEYSTDGSTGWATSGSVGGANVPNIRFVRVTANVTSLPLYLLPVIGTGTTATVQARAVAGQTPENPPNGVFPYSPIANVDATNSSQLPATGDPFGYTVGQQYDLKWPHNASVGTVGNDKVPCAGDDNAAMVNHNSTDMWGEIVMSSASAISNAITDDLGKVDIGINQSVSPTSGDKNKEVTAIQNRIAQDGDTTDNTISSYLGNPAHNGRRLITVIVNNGGANSAGVAYPASEQAIGLGYAQFLLLSADQYSKNGGSNNPWCAIYVGPAPALGTPNGGGGGLNGSGVSVIRLTQ